MGHNAEDNCVTARWGGKQSKVKLQPVGDEHDSALRMRRASRVDGEVFSKATIRRKMIEHSKNLTGIDTVPVRAAWGGW
ncbi:hypothetical protein [Rubritalea tangerina]|uniref:hypothetical protein n=1 Tax=Rubritalea tangerina TaxID=430798 RepID=UPI0036149C42